LLANDWRRPRSSLLHESQPGSTQSGNIPATAGVTGSNHAPATRKTGRSRSWGRLFLATRQSKVSASHPKAAIGLESGLGAASDPLQTFGL